MSFLARYRFNALIILVAIAITSYYYYPALDNYFIGDDYWFLMTSGGNARNVLFGLPHLRLTGNVIMWFNYFCLGFNHIGYNLISFVVHGVNVVLIFLLIKKISGDEKTSFLTATVYAAMSVYCDAILYKAALLTLTNLTFYCLALLLYLKGKEQNRFYYWSLVVFFFGMFNKEEIASFPLMILLLEGAYFGNYGRLKPVIKRIMPYLLIILTYIVVSLVLTRFHIIYQEQFDRLSKIRPFHSLVGGFVSFFAKPDGFLDNRHTIITGIVLAFVIPTALYFNQNRKLFLLGLGWIFLTFLPQSFSNLTQYTPKYFFNSISRHLYIPSVGAALVLAVIIMYSFRSINRQVLHAVIALFIVAMVTYNAPIVHARSATWGVKSNAMDMRNFMSALMQQVPSLEDGAHIMIDNPPAGRAYMTRALRAFYKSEVVFVDDSAKSNLASVPSLYWVENRLSSGMGIMVVRIK